MHVNKLRYFPETKRSAGNNMLWTGKNKTWSELSFFTKNMRKKFIIVIQCDFKGSQNTSLFLFFFDSCYITKRFWS